MHVRESFGGGGGGVLKRLVAGVLEGGREAGAVFSIDRASRMKT